jgi:hypothetical protein
MKKLLLLASLFATLFTACSTDIAINAEWKDTTLVLGLLNTDHKTHYIRIHKAFLDEKRGAFEVAQIQDSLYYQTLVVKVERIVSDAVIETYNCVKIDTAILQPGIFASPDLILYRFSTDTFLDVNSTYRLVIETPFNNLVTSQLKPIGLPRNLPNGLPPNTPPPPNYAGINWSSQVPQVFLAQPTNARRFDMTVRIYYDEWNRFTVTPSDTPGLQRKFLDWRVEVNQQFAVINSSNVTQLRVPGRNMFSFMNSSIPKNENLNRRLRGTLFLFDFADDDFNTFLQINNPSSSLVDVRPTFTNINNGIGIFAARRSVPDLKLIENTPNFPFSSSFYREALGGVGTDSLRARYPDLNFVP